jgi:hypothetical protein
LMVISFGFSFFVNFETPEKAPVATTTV